MSESWWPGVVVSLSGIPSVFIFALRVFGDWKFSGELARLKNIKNQDSSFLKAMKHTFFAWRVLPAGCCDTPLPKPIQTWKKESPAFSNSLLTLMCCDGCSPFTVSGSAWGATATANYLSIWALSCHAVVLYMHLWDVLVPNICVVALVSRFFMLRLCHSPMSVHRF